MLDKILLDIKKLIKERMIERLLNDLEKKKITLTKTDYHQEKIYIPCHEL